MKSLKHCSTLVLLLAAALASVPASSTAVASVDASATATASASASAAPSLAPGVPRVFEPEDDWKAIEPGQEIPGGLDVRLDLSGGGRWARKLPRAGGASSAAALAVAPDSGAVAAVAAAGGGGASVGGGGAPSTGAPSPAAPRGSASGLPAALLRDERTAVIADILLSLPTPPDDEGLARLRSGRGAGMSPDAVADVLARAWERRQAELADAFASAKTESQLVQGLLAELVVDDDGGGRDGGDAGAASGAPSVALAPRARARRAAVAVLEDIESFVSSLHNAEDFAATGGLAAMVPLLNASAPGVPAAAAWVIGSAAKGAPAVQAAALRAGAMPALVDLLRRSAAVASAAHRAGGAGAPAVAPATLAASKAAYALGALLRYCPDGQAAFAAAGGLREVTHTLMVMAHIANRPDADTHPVFATPEVNAARKSAAGVVGKFVALFADLIGLVDEDEAAGDGGGSGAPAGARAPVAAPAAGAANDTAAPPPPPPPPAAPDARRPEGAPVRVTVLGADGPAAPSTARPAGGCAGCPRGGKALPAAARVLQRADAFALEELCLQLPSAVGAVRRVCGTVESGGAGVDDAAQEAVSAATHATKTIMVACARVREELGAGGGPPPMMMG